MAVTRAANMPGPPYPHARDVVPKAYRSLGAVENRGSVTEASNDEREAVMALEIEPVTLQLSDEVREYIKLRESFSPDVERLVREELTRMAELITKRVAEGGGRNATVKALRTAPNFSTLYGILFRKWREQEGVCGLCHGKLVAGSENEMTQPSADRIDSSNDAYDDDNVWITHLACNLAKNQYGLEKFEDWLSTVRHPPPHVK